MSKVLVIEDNPVLCRVLCNWLADRNIETVHTASAGQARTLIESSGADVVLSDLRLPDGDGVEILEWMRKKNIPVPYIVMTDYAEVGSAVRAMKLGAKDYLPKSLLSSEKLFAVIDEILRHKKVVNSGYRELFRRTSAGYRKAERLAGLVAATDISVLIQGDNGTGKEHIAHLIHNAGRRSDKPFVAVDCGAVTKELARSELFGHVRGSFTGATEDKAGLFREAEGGTLFLDEVGNLPYEVQMILLRALQERHYRPVGGKHEMPCDIRIVAATNEDLKRAVAEGRFREDLYYRLNDFHIPVPPLRECREDIMPLAGYFRTEFSREINKRISGFTDEACVLLQSYSFPGNVRELKSCIRKAVLLAEKDVIAADDLDIDRSAVTENLTLKPGTDECRRITDALEIAHYNKTKAAKLLNISRFTLYEKIKKYGIEAEK